MLGKGLVRVRGRSDDGQVVRWMSGECQVNVRWMSGECQVKPGEYQVNFRWSLNSLNQGKVRVWWGSGEGLRWISIWAWLCWTWNLLLIGTRQGILRKSERPGKKYLICMQYLIYWGNFSLPLLSAINFSPCCVYTQSPWQNLLWDMAFMLSHNVIIINVYMALFKANSILDISLFRSILKKEFQF